MFPLSRRQIADWGSYVRGALLIEVDPDVARVPATDRPVHGVIEGERRADLSREASPGLVGRGWYSSNWPGSPPLRNPTLNVASTSRG